KRRGVFLHGTLDPFTQFSPLVRREGQDLGKVGFVIDEAGGFSSPVPVDDLQAYQFPEQARAGIRADSSERGANRAALVAFERFLEFGRDSIRRVPPSRFTIAWRLASHGGVLGARDEPKSPLVIRIRAWN